MGSPPNDDSAKLIALAREGDVHAFSQLMEMHQTRLMGQALAFCGDRELAQDLVQETMIAAWRSLRRYGIVPLLHLALCDFAAPAQAFIALVCETPPVTDSRSDGFRRAT